MQTHDDLDIPASERYDRRERAYVAYCAEEAGLTLDGLPLHTRALRPDAPAPDDGSAA